MKFLSVGVKSRDAADVAVLFDVNVIITPYSFRGCLAKLINWVYTYVL